MHLTCDVISAEAVIRTMTEKQFHDRTLQVLIRVCGPFSPCCEGTASDTTVTWIRVRYVIRQTTLNLTNKTQPAVSVRTVLSVWRSTFGVFFSLTQKAEIWSPSQQPDFSTTKQLGFPS